MTQEEKQLLLADLSARLPYGTMVKCNTDYRHEFDEELSVIHIMNFCQFEVKPYLRLMSSMTEEEEKEICQSMKDYNLLPGPDRAGVFCGKIVDWLNSHHFDFRGLIPIGLALEAPKDMYEIKEK